MYDQYQNPITNIDCSSTAISAEVSKVSELYIPLAAVMSVQVTIRYSLSMWIQKSIIVCISPKHHGKYYNHKIWECLSLTSRRHFFLDQNGSLVPAGTLYCITLASHEHGEKCNE